MLLQKLVFFLHKKRPDMQHIQNRIESGGSEKKNNNNNRKHRRMQESALPNIQVRD